MREPAKRCAAINITLRAHAFVFLHFLFHPLISFHSFDFERVTGKENDKEEVVSLRGLDCPLVTTI
jgi:hypothetical protein